MEKRCRWVTDDPIYIKYHDEEWGNPVKDDRKLFEFLVLESAQAGLSWITVLNKRENYRKAYDDFDFEKIALYDDDKVDELLRDQGIIRNKLKIGSSVSNAKAFIRIREEFGSFSDYLWGFTDNEPINNNYMTSEDVPVFTDLAVKISKDLKKREFKFVGPTIIYSYMQAVGLVNDHTMDCSRCFYNKKTD